MSPLLHHLVTGMTDAVVMSTALILSICLGNKYPMVLVQDTVRSASQTPIS